MNKLLFILFAAPFVLFAAPFLLISLLAILIWIKLVEWTTQQPMEMWVEELWPPKKQQIEPYEDPWPNNHHFAPLQIEPHENPWDFPNDVAPFRSEQIEIHDL